MSATIISLEQFFINRQLGNELERAVSLLIVDDTCYDEPLYQFCEDEFANYINTLSISE